MGKLWDKDHHCVGVVCEAPRGSVRMMQLKAKQSEGFNVIIHPEPDGASQTKPT